MGFKKGYSAAELVLCFRFSTARSALLQRAIAQTSLSSQPHDISWHASIGSAQAHQRETQASALRPRHGFWSAGEVRPQRGLKQVCSCSPLLLWWCVQDAILLLAQSWRARGMGVVTRDNEWVTPSKGQATWIMAQSPEYLARVATELQEAMQQNAGLRVRPEKCTEARFGLDSSLPTTDELPTVLRTMSSTCMRVLSDLFHVDLG